MTLNHRVYKLARLMAPDPAFIEPLLLAEREERLDGQLPLTDLERLGEIICRDSGTIDYHLRLGRDDMDIPYIKGNFKVTLKLICQRCLEPFDLDVSGELSIGMAMSESEIRLLPEKYEPLLLTTDLISLSTLIEDEILLGIPMVPMHKQGSCPSTGKEETRNPGRENPFAVLKGMIVKSSNTDAGEK